MGWLVPYQSPCVRHLLFSAGISSRSQVAYQHIDGRIAQIPFDQLESMGPANIVSKVQ
jgi:hypothetical protein